MKQQPDKHSGHFLHRISYNYRERMVGFFVFFAFLLFSLFVLISIKNQHLFEDRVTFYIEVNSSEGINPGSVVQVLGTEVGRISTLTLAQNHKIRVELKIYEKQREMIRIGAKAFVNRLTNIGNALVDIRSDSMSAPLLPDGATIPVEETPSLNDLLLGLASLIQSADSKNLLAKVETLLPDAERTLENVHNIIAQIASGHGTVGAAVFDRQVEEELKIVVKSIAQLSLQAEDIINTAKQRLEQLEPLLNDAGQITDDVQEATQRLPAMVTELNETLSSLQTALTLINDELADLPGIGLETRSALKRTNRLLESAQQTWPLSIHQRQPTATPVIPPHPLHD